VSAGGYYRGSPMDSGEITFYAVPRDGVVLPVLEERIRAVLGDVARDGVTAEELARAKHSLVAEAVYAQDSQATLARIFGAGLSTGDTIERIQTWPSRIEAVTADDVKAAAARYLAGEPAVIGRLEPEAAASPAASGAGETPSQDPSAAPAKP